MDVYHTSTHDVVLVRIYNAGLKCAARGSLEIQDPKLAKQSPSGHNRTTKPRIDNRKKLLSSNNSTCPHNMVNFGPIAAEIGSGVRGTPVNFNGFRVLAALLHGTLVVGVGQTAALNTGRHLYSAGRSSRWVLAHILVNYSLRGPHGLWRCAALVAGSHSNDVTT